MRKHTVLPEARSISINNDNEMEVNYFHFSIVPVPNLLSSFKDTRPVENVQHPNKKNLSDVLYAASRHLRTSLLATG